jgi:signal recognition particle subunit SRP54
MGDVLSLIEEVQSKVDQSEAEEQLKKLQKNEFTLDDFRSQLRQVKRLGSFSKIMKLLPDQLLGGIGMPQLDDEQSAQMESELKRTEAIIDSMTAEERNDHRILNAGRRRRVARGSGTDVADVNALIKQYVQMRQMMKQMSGSGLFGGMGAGGSGGGGGMKGRMMRKMAGMMGMPDMSAMMGGGGESSGNGMDLGSMPQLPGAPSRKKLKKKPRHKKKR